ncbi:hypothetical protein BJG92_03086 [Arthrobacter sp. SO5]|nr:hypothetical protein [Arthrobacter sp. SO5]
MRTFERTRNHDTPTAVPGARFRGAAFISRVS